MRCSIGPWLSLLMLATACSSETPGRNVPVVWQLDQNLAGDEADFDTDTGYHVHLDEARLALGAVYAYSAAPSSVRAMASMQLERWFVSVAHAHGGLDAESGRKVLAELPQLTIVDPLAPEPWFSDITVAEAGTVDAVKLEFAESGPSELHGGSVFVRGQAERAGETLRFEAAVSLDAAVKARSVDLTGLNETLDTDVVLHIAVHPREWFRLCELDQLPAALADEPVQVTADTQVGRALVIGVRSPDAFSFRVDSEK